MEGLLPLIIQLLSGALGGNLAGAIFHRLSLGTMGNSLLGILGGGLGAYLISMLGITLAPGGNLDLSGIIGSVASGAVGGGVLMAVFGFARAIVGR
ncbi:hypothetical protein [Thalassotalea mangrovi]|uniref:GlsB/YeaQ/YmgE family stress response membrane protein n=1 Tax=Thalassotalea mangrovi TaxID=2572245 RepID=A0A4U1BB73_9GAMM|nr:hypothetical protein [Thalassotalea mangrovi]TKB47418.1 hypothetical protein E8M12_01115 [Thalassotalea mangrovi]